MPINLRSIYDDSSAFEMQLVMNFCFGILFAPWNYNIFFTIIYFIVLEIVLYFMNIGYSLENRIYLFMSYFAGYAIGRLLKGRSLIN